MNDTSKRWYIRTEDGKVYGPAEISDLTTWAQDGRIEPSSFVSQDRKSWMPAQLMAALEMKWLIETEPGKFFGPFNREVLIRLSKKDGMPAGAKVYRMHEMSVEQDPPPVVKEVIKEVPVEKIVVKEVVKEVPVEKIVEKIVEKEVIKEVPVEKIVEKIVEVDPPARTEIVMAEVVEPVADTPPPLKSPDSLFKGVGRSQLAALEAAARNELANARKNRMPFSFFGGKKK